MDPIKAFVVKFKLAFIALILVLDFGAGWYVKGKFVKADENVQTKQVVTGTATGIVQSAEKSQQVDAAVQKSDTNADQIAAAVAARLKAQNAKAPSAPNCPADRLDAGTVRLLNAAAKDGPVDTRAIINGEIGKTP